MNWGDEEEIRVDFIRRMTLMRDEYTQWAEQHEREANDARRIGKDPREPLRVAGQARHVAKCCQETIDRLLAAPMPAEDG
ncbi:hypothetical protein WME90_36325 [Sorangium sp. So ce375]|uniref:hypothetical protein n=1 Tax=Sorangium sp. So ce375 TaxID=3133306 RepID=UPI003F5B17B0